VRRTKPRYRDLAPALRLRTALLCEMNRMAIVPANEFFELDALAVFRDLTKAH
jgi:hypothetical protein